MRTGFICIGLIGSFCLGRFASGWSLPVAIGVALALTWAAVRVLAESVDDPRWGRVDYPWTRPGQR